jgi:YD repeat-containing protein
MLKALIKYFQRQRTYRQTYNELAKISTKELQDIGIHRSMISRIAAESAYGKDKANA